MNHSPRPFLVLLLIALTTCNMKATETRTTTLSEPDLRFVKLLDAAKHGDIAKEVEVAEGYLVGHGVRQNPQLAAEWYEKAANAGDAAAQNQIGYMYQAGMGVPKDPERASHWYQLSAANGFVLGKVNLAVAYVWGIGVRRNQELGAALLNEASKKGSGVAAAYLGDLYVTGNGVTADADRAVACYERGAKLHSYYAEYKLAVFLSKPDEHPLDLARSVSLLRDSVSQGYIPAMYALGLIAVNHPESKVPHTEGMSVLRSASDAGSWKASAILAVLARDGKWAEKGEADAYRFFKRAANQGDESVKEYVNFDLQRLSTVLDAPTIAALNKEETEWASNHPVSLELIHKSDRKPEPYGSYALTSPPRGEHARGIVPATPD